MSYHRALGAYEGDAQSLAGPPAPSSNMKAPWYYVVNDARPRCGWDTAEGAAANALHDLLHMPMNRGVAYGVVTYWNGSQEQMRFAIFRDGSLVPVGGCCSPCCTVPQEHIHVADPCGQGPRRPAVGKVAPNAVGCSGDGLGAGDGLDGIFAVL